MREETNREKVRDMIRSILPSTKRKRARQAKAFVKRRHRRQIHDVLRRQEPEPPRTDLTRDVRLGGLVAWRRAGDKLNHFIRWCERMTAGMTADEALAYVRRILPANLIGEHAFAHWEQHRKPRHRWNTAFHMRSPERELQSYRDSTRFRLRRALQHDPGLHARLNAAIKSSKAEGERRRLLAGAHDIAAFVDELALRCRHGRPFRHYETERTILSHLLTETEKGGHRPPFDV